MIQGKTCYLLCFFNKTFNYYIITFVLFAKTRLCCKNYRAKAKGCLWSGTAVKFLAELQFLMKGKSVKDCCNLTSGAFAQGTHIDFGAD